jgi:hypothetical protein
VGSFPGLGRIRGRSLRNEGRLPSSPGVRKTENGKDSVLAQLDFQLVLTPHDFRHPEHSVGSRGRLGQVVTFVKANLDRGETRENGEVQRVGKVEGEATYSRGKKREYGSDKKERSRRTVITSLAGRC